jgi:hypothetical protein
MLLVVRTPEPSIPLDPAAGPAPAAGWLRRVRQRPERCVWVVPTPRRCRLLRLEWQQAAGQAASLQPAVHTFDSFVAYAHSFAVSR